MAALSALRTELQYRAGDSAGINLSAARATQFINNALEDWATTVEPSWRDYGFYVTASQFRYDLPADWMKPKSLHWYQNGEYEIPYIDPKEFQRRGFRDWDYKSNRPRAYTIIDRDLYIGPIPSTSSNTSTLDGNHTSSVATISVADGTKFHDPAGMILINSEQIAYQGVSTNDLTIAVRAQGGTTAAAHTDTDTVKRLDLVASYYYLPASLSADTDVPDIETRWHRTLLHHAIGNYLIMDGRENEGMNELRIYEAKKVEAKREIRRLQRDRMPRVYSPYR